MLTEEADCVWCSKQDIKRQWFSGTHQLHNLTPSVQQYSVQYLLDVFFSTDNHLRLFCRLNLLWILHDDGNALFLLRLFATVGHHWIRQLHPSLKWLRTMVIRHKSNHRNNFPVLPKPTHSTPYEYLFPRSESSEHIHRSAKWDTIRSHSIYRETEL